MTERVKRKVQIYSIYTKEWREVEGFYPEEWLCALPSCNKVTSTSQRRQSKKSDPDTHCSSKCRARHESIIRNREKRASRPDFITVPEGVKS